MKHSIGEKYEAINSGLDDEYVMVHINTLNDLLVVPEHLKAKSTVTLKISRWFRGTMELYEDRIEADLLFSGTYFSCSIPLGAVWGITTAKGENKVWPDASPPEVLLSLMQPQLYAHAKERQEKKNPKPKKSPPPADEKKKFPRANLKRVK